MDRVFCGMVGKGEDDGNVIYGTSAFAIRRRAGGQVMNVSDAWWTFRSPIDVGGTTHVRTPGGERLHRVNLLEVVAYGETERQKQGVRGLLGKLSYRHQGA
jgi:hypothetical protein